ncbi:ArsR/SmtB family transcription factor [Chitinilyticum litopenaei]|uniref:ArsR/SmtB family transcription factor n=1 Tax=Chitinilyticum litopenaei TaxID=1121276 RepID=UPI0003FBDE9A|nr:metalloregulator ArsR/SmtB family transcription factor [Chitinilyticum litopenaei]
MEKNTATLIFEALSSGVRLDIFRLLVSQGKSGLVAGDIAERLQVPPSSLSFHLKELKRAELVTAEQESRFVRYRANIPVMLDVIAYLTDECCQGHPEDCAGFRAESACSPAVLPALSCPSCEE